MMTTRAMSESLGFELPDGTAVAATTDADDPLFDQFFALYDHAFILPSEKEERRGFVDCLALNHGPAHARIAARWGPFCEWVLLVRDRHAADADAVVGGANFICYPLPVDAGAAVLSMNLNYIFVVPEHRRRGYLEKITAACRELARRSFPAIAGDAALLTFVEQNNPLTLSRDDYVRDSAHAGIDQAVRVRIWQRAGARIIDFPYVQPALSDDQLADHNLLLSVIGAQGHELDPCLLKRHLERFFAISVLKDRDPASEPVSRRQLALCDEAHRAGRAFALSAA